MQDNRYLSYDEQFKDVLNREEIERIENPELRAIRSKYLKMYRDILLDEQNVPDSELESVTNQIQAREQKELEVFKKKLDAAR